MRTAYSSWAGWIIVVLIIGRTFHVRLAMSAGPTETATAAPPPAKTPQAIEPRVQEVLNGVCAELSKPKEYSYHAEITFDSVLPSLVKLQYSAALDATVVRPNRLAISYQSDLGAKYLWYNGETLTIFDPPHMAYASTPVPGTIDAMLAEVANDKNLSIPLKGFDVSNPCAVIYKEALRSKYVGINDAAGIDCDHLAFIQEDADWQVWMARGKKPLPRKIVITYKKLPTQPQWEAVLSNWRFNQQVPASFFQPKVPKEPLRLSS